MILRQHFLTLVKYGNNRENEINGNSKHFQVFKIFLLRRIIRVLGFSNKLENCVIESGQVPTSVTNSKIKVKRTMDLQNFIEYPRLYVIPRFRQSEL